VSHFPTADPKARFGCADTNQRSTFTDLTMEGRRWIPTTPSPMAVQSGSSAAKVQNSQNDVPLLHESTCHLIRKADFHERQTCSVHTISTFSPLDRVTGFTVSHFPTSSFEAGFSCADTNQRSIFTDFTIKRADTPERQTLETRTLPVRVVN
jgi:hypothetical protein